MTLLRTGRRVLGAALISLAVTAGSAVVAQRYVTAGVTTGAIKD